MSALDQLRDYDSENSSEDESSQTFDKLPVPNLITDNKFKPDHIDISESHGGRVRSFPHERGNWATYVFIPFVANEFSTLTNHLQQECSKINNFEISSNFHVSLSRTVVLKYHWIPSFTLSLKKIFQKLHKFTINFNTLKVYCNDDQTRTFLGLEVDSNLDYIEEIINSIDTLLQEFKLEKFYEKPSFHLSLLWCVGNYKKELKNILPQLQYICQEYLSENINDSNLYVIEIHCKSGNKIFKFMLD